MTTAAPLLSIVMATFDDFDGCEFTLTFLRNELTGRGVVDQVELLVVNNNPESYDGKRIASLCEKVGARHIAFGEKVGSAAPRDHAIRSARGKWVACCDCHIQFLFGVLPKLLEFCRTTESADIFHGPLVNEGMLNDDGTPRLVWTHWVPVWGNNGMLGKQAGLPMEQLSAGKPIEIVGAGLGLFLVMREHWMGFPPELQGFGSEELCLHQAYRQAGRKAWLLPWMPWWHKFRDPNKPPSYPSYHGQTAWNYLCWYKRIGFPSLSGIRAAFVTADRLPAPQVNRSSVDTWKQLLLDLGIDEFGAYERERSGELPILPIELADSRIVIPPLPPSITELAGLPGSELQTINRECFGIESKADCSCSQKINQMNAWGVAGCRAHYWTIVGWMKDEAQNYGWADKVAAAAGAVKSGIAFRIKWTDPWPGIITEAINRAEAKQKAMVAA